MTKHSHDIGVLNSLIATVLDSCDGYNEAADNTRNVMVADLFKQWATERRQVVTHLRAAVHELGGEAKDDGTLLASVHRMFLDLRAHMSKDDKAVVEEVERGEDHIKQKFEEALKDEEVTLPARTAIQLAYPSIEEGHDEARKLKFAYEKR
jgi:uncharacterized protein (TIGR02284 family)